MMRWPYIVAWESYFVCVCVCVCVSVCVCVCVCAWRVDQL